MTREAPPGFDLEFESLASDSVNRHEEMVDIFGRYIMWLREWVSSSTLRLVDDENARAELGAIHRMIYEQVASMSESDRKQALELAQRSVDSFIQLLLQLLAHRGRDFPLGRSHAIRFHLKMEIVDCNSENLVLEETINRNGKKHFADYWGRWRNRFSNA